MCTCLWHVKIIRHGAPCIDLDSGQEEGGCRSALKTLPHNWSPSCSGPYPVQSSTYNISAKNLSTILGPRTESLIVEICIPAPTFFIWGSGSHSSKLPKFFLLKFIFLFQTFRFGLFLFFSVPFLCSFVSFGSCWIMIMIGMQPKDCLMFQRTFDTTTTLNDICIHQIYFSCVMYIAHVVNDICESKYLGFTSKSAWPAAWLVWTAARFFKSAIHSSSSSLHT